MNSTITSDQPTSLRETSPELEDSQDGSSDRAVVVSRIFITAFFVTFIIFNVHIFWLMYRARKRRERQQQEQETRQNGDNNIHTIAEQLESMTTDAKLTYYSKLFDRHGNQIELKNEQIIAVVTTTDEKDLRIRYAGENDIETGFVKCHFSEEKCECEEKCEDIDNHHDHHHHHDHNHYDHHDDEECFLSPDTIHTCDEPETCDGRKQHEDKKNTKIDGQCIICIENFHPGDVIVYNKNTCQLNNGDAEDNTSDSIPVETPTDGCSHVYHKACFVHYLASRKVSETGLQNGETDVPKCPTCRKPYCDLLSIPSDGNDDDQTTRVIALNVGEDEDDISSDANGDEIETRSDVESRNQVEE